MFNSGASGSSKAIGSISHRGRAVCWQHKYQQSAFRWKLLANTLILLQQFSLWQSDPAIVLSAFRPSKQQAAKMVKGSCVCGDWTYQYEGEPVAVAVCHCRPCRKTAGTNGSVNSIIPDGQVNVVKAQLDEPQH
jgi:hypothetical protein